jgi:WD40 repeat protein/serine/threonine protein kinase
MKHDNCPGGMAREEEIFNAALLLDGPMKRSAFLDLICEEDVALRARIERLLALADKSFLESMRVPPRRSAAEITPKMASVAGETLAVDSAAESPGERIGRYKLLQKIGEGGCGLVYMAAQTEPVRRRVALKVIRLGMDTKAVIARFEAERQALAMMDHPNIAKVLDAGATDAGRPYFVMELVRGVKITDFCNQNHLTLRQRLELFIQVCQAIQHAHQKGIIHRDIKPSNILVTVNDSIAVPKVIDFGIAKATTGQQLTDKTLFTAFEQFIGTPAYMSPEQAVMTSLDIDTRSDIYALGVLLYELLTGKTPFDAKDLIAAGFDAMRRTILEKEPARPSTRLSTMVEAELAVMAKDRQSNVPRLLSLVRGDLDWIVMKAIEKDRARRYETANGLAMDLKRFLGNEPVLARPPSAVYRVQKAFRRNKIAFASGIAIAAALLLGAVVSTWQAVRATRLQRQQSRLREAAQSAKTNETEQRQRAEAGELSARQNLYAASLNLAQRAWEQNDFAQVRQLLQDSRAYKDHGFEWGYLQRQTHLALKTLRGHMGQVPSVAFSPDGLRVVTGSSDGTAKVWDEGTGRELRTLVGHSSGIGAVAFSPDGLKIASGSTDQTVKVWDALNGKILQSIKAHDGYVTSVAFSPDGQRIVTGSVDKTARIWEAASGSHLLTLEGHTGEIRFVAFSLDGERIFTGSEDHTAKVWETATGKPLLVFKGERDWLGSGAFSPDGQRIVTVKDNIAKVWETATGKELVIFKGHSKSISSAAFSRDGQRLVTGSGDRTAKVWDANTAEELLTLKGHGEWIMSVAFSQDGKKIITGSEDDTARIWDATINRELVTLRGHNGWIQAAAFSPNGERVVTGSHDKTAKVWEAATGKCVLNLTGHKSWVGPVAFSPDGRRILTAGGDETARIWDAVDAKQLLTLTGHGGWIGAAGFSPDGQRIVTGSFDRTTRVWDAFSGKELFLVGEHGADVGFAAFSPDGQRIITSSGDKTAKVCAATRGNYLLSLEGHTAVIESIGFSADGQKIVSGSDDGTAKVWDVASGACLQTFKGHGASVQAAAFSPDGRRIVTGGRDRTAKVWEVVSGNCLLTLSSPSGRVGSVAFSPDGQRIVTVGEDSTATVWRAATTPEIGAWQEEETAAEEHLAVLLKERASADERERALRAQDEGAIKQWLVLAPIYFEGRSGVAALDQEQILHEASLRPHAGEGVKIGQSEWVWKSLRLQDFTIDFDYFLGGSPSPEWCVGYAVSYIQSEATQAGLLLKVASDDQSKIYLNGKEIYRRGEVRSLQAGEEEVSGVILKTGLNVLVFKVVNEISAWKGSVRFIDGRGNPLKGIKVSLTP